MEEAPPIQVGSAAWWLARARNTGDRARRKRMLSLDLIADAALVVLDAEGAEALTMRRVAQHLQCSQAALYRHVSSRDELVVVAMDRALGMGLQPPPADLTWRQSLEWQARSFREFLFAHPGLVPFLRGTQRLSPMALAGIEFSIHQYMSIGLNVRDAHTTASVFATFTIGSALLGLGLDNTDPREQSMRRRLYESLDPHQHPLLTAHADVISRVSNRDEFEFGLAALLDGLEARIASGSAAQRPAAPPEAAAES
ncbi:TetR/AcrR family transcriptional regulator [Actinoplanes sp. RD1]|uniref:TetR/AcrR family transcriptional regulator n=1 Tax=Actinoplanes sp. RD1 TaxID=3064538 RepID=UPI0027419F1A|nr:TetR/AcrR family transcriptional regulator [Actinoplanes sp. RD1]